MLPCVSGASSSVAQRVFLLTNSPRICRVHTVLGRGRRWENLQPLFLKDTMLEGHCLLLPSRSPRGTPQGSAWSAQDPVPNDVHECEQPSRQERKFHTKDGERRPHRKGKGHHTSSYTDKSVPGLYPWSHPAREKTHFQLRLRTDGLPWGRAQDPLHEDGDQFL